MAQPSGVVDFNQKLSCFDEHWSPKIIAESNDWHVKLVKAAGEFVWHSHPETDEIFVVLSGSLTIGMKGRPDARLRSGQLVVVPRGVEHRPDAGDGCSMLLLEPVGVPNTGDQPGAALSAVDEWI